MLSRHKASHLNITKKNLSYYRTAPFLEGGVSKMKKLSFCALFLLSGMLLSCKSSHYDYSYTTNDDSTEKAPEILFATFIVQHVDSTTTIELKDTRITQGNLKNQPANSHATDRVYVAQLRDDKTEISGFYVDHPLRKNIEYINERDELTTKYIELAEAEFFVRVPMAENCRFLRLDEVRGARVVNSFVFDAR